MSAPEQDPMVVGIAQIIDHPSVYMGGPSRNSLRIAEAIVKEFGSDLCASGQQVRVKPLEWEPSKTSYTQADCVFGQYQISFLSEFEWWQLSAPYKPGSYWKDGFTSHASKSAAKAAAQADYERRILAALTPEVKVRAGVEIACNHLADIVAARGMFGVCADDDLEWVMKTAELALAALTPAPQPSAATPTAQEAVPVWKSVERKFYRSEWPLAKLLEARNGGLVTDEGEAWVYRYTHKDGVGGEYDMLVRRELVAHPPQPSETVAAVIEAANMARNRLEMIADAAWNGDGRDLKRSIAGVFSDFDAALRALKGGE